MKQIEVRTASHRQMVDITREVASAIDGAGNGICHVYVPHTTAAVVINEHADPDVARDLLAAYEAMVPSGSLEVETKSQTSSTQETVKEAVGGSLGSAATPPYSSAPISHSVFTGRPSPSVITPITTCFLPFFPSRLYPKAANGQHVPSK